MKVDIVLEEEGFFIDSGFLFNLFDKVFIVFVIDWVESRIEGGWLGIRLIGVCLGFWLGLI